MWVGWSAADGELLRVDLSADFMPWHRAFDDRDAPHFKWFSGARTNACFNEVDRHVLAGFGYECTYIFKGDRWTMPRDNGRGSPADQHLISRNELLVETAKCACVAGLGAARG